MSEASSAHLARQPDPTRIRLRQALQGMAPVVVFKSMKSRKGIEDALRSVAEARVKAVRMGRDDLVAELDQQCFEVEQWQVGLNALDNHGYQALKEMVAREDLQALHDAAREIFFCAYDPLEGGPDASSRAGPELTMVWFVESLREWVTGCEATLAEVGMTPTKWLSSAPAYDINRTERRNTNRFTLPPTYSEAVTSEQGSGAALSPFLLSPVNEEEERNATGTSRQSEAPELRASQSRGNREASMYDLMYQVTGQAGARGAVVASSPGSQVVPPVKKGLLEAMVNGLDGMITSFRGGSGSGSGTSSRRGGSPAANARPDGPYSNPVSSSSRVHSPASRSAARGNSSHNPSSPPPRRPFPPPESLSPSTSLGSSTPQASSSPPAAHQQHADLYHRITRKKTWAEILRQHVRDEPQQRQYRLQGVNPVPLVFDAVDGSGDTAVLDLHVGNVVLRNAAPRATVAGGLSHLVDRVVQFAGSVFTQQF